MLKKPQTEKQYILRVTVVSKVRYKQLVLRIYTRMLLLQQILAEEEIITKSSKCLD